jgi:glycosyltransferase involved in cell wall biosynthesis
MSSPPSSKDASVILATRNRDDVLAQTLSHLGRQATGDLSWEVIVVDNGSTDGTSGVLADAARRLPLVSLRESAPGKNRALNQALAVARGELLIFTDDDVIADPGWIANLVGASRRWPTATIFGGRIQLAFPPGTPAWLKEPLHGAMNFARYAPAEPEGQTTHLPNGPNFAVRATALQGLRYREDIGPQAGTAYAMGSETELIVRLRERGATMVYVPSATVEHVVQPNQLTDRYLFGRSYRLGRGQVRNRQSHHEADVFLLRAPRYLWRSALSSGVGFFLGLAGGRKRRLASGLRLFFYLGCIAEHRAAHAAKA